MQRLEVNGAVRPIYGSLGVKGLRFPDFMTMAQDGGKVDKLTKTTLKSNNKQP